MSGFDPQWFVASSSQAHQTNFRFRAQVCDDSGNVLKEFRIPKDPDYGTFFFDAHRHIENYLSYDIANLIAQTTGWQKSVNCHMEYYLNVAEEYGATVSVQASGNSAHVIAINSAENFSQWGQHSINNYRVIFFGGDDSTKWLTNQPSRIPIRIGDSYEMGTITNVSSSQGIFSLRVRTYDSSGTLLKTATINNPYGSIATTDEQFLSILCGPDDLNATSLSSGSHTLIEDDTSYYTVDILNSFGTQKIESKRFDIDRTCTRDGSYSRLYWLNPLGRFDAFNFTQLGEDSIQVEQSRYSRVLGVKTATSLTYTKNQVESSVFHSGIKQIYKLRSGFVNSEISLWLKELIASPRVYMIIDGSFVPVNITTNSYTAKKTLQDKLFNVEIEVELSIKDQRQRL